MITYLPRIDNFDRDDSTVLHEKSIKRCIGIPTVTGDGYAIARRCPFPTPEQRHQLIPRYQRNLYGQERSHTFHHANRNDGLIAVFRIIIRRLRLRQAALEAFAAHAHVLVHQQHRLREDVSCRIHKALPRKESFILMPGCCTGCCAAASSFMMLLLRRFQTAAAAANPSVGAAKPSSSTTNSGARPLHGDKMLEVKGGRVPQACGCAPVAGHGTQRR